MVWVNDSKHRLYVVKREHAEEYYTGGGYAVPKLYKIGYAKTAARELNGEYDRYWTIKWNNELLTKSDWAKVNPEYAPGGHLEKYADDNYKFYSEDHAKGPWIVAEVQFTASKVDIND